jgi:hypothetical protein
MTEADMSQEFKAEWAMRICRLQIALCAFNGIDFLVTWNCRHLANAFHRHQIESVIEARGYRCPVICTPEELMED